MAFDINKFDPTKENAIIQASAGTGKTYNVKEIVKKLVINEEFNNASSDEKERIANDNLKKILIVTFTEKATGELKDRIRSELEESLPEISFDINNFNIFTIHSFCQNSIKEFCVDANLPIGLNVITNGKYYLNNFIDKYIREGDIFNEISALIINNKELKIDNLKERFISAISNYCKDKSIISLRYLENKSFNDYYKNDRDFKKHFDNLENSNEELSRVLAKYLKNKNYLSGVVADFNFSKGKFDSDEANALFEYFYDKKGKKTKAGLPGVTFDDMKNNNSELLSNYQKLSQGNDIKLLVFSIALKKKSGKGKIDFTSKFKLLDEISNQQDKDAIEYILKLSSNILDDKNDVDKYLVFKYIDDLFIKWQDFKLSNKMQSFNDMISSVREKIKTNPKFKKDLQNKYQYAIIDEFQDTNQLQFDIFKSIFMEDDKHKIIVVGDPKQSIYQFQGADLNVYESAKEEILNNKIVKGYAHDLDTNWRSTEGIIKSCNDFFKDSYFERGIINPTTKISFNPSYYSGCGKEVQYKGKEVESFWVGLKNDENGNNLPTDPDSYCEEIIKQIIDFCTYENGKTKLQIKPKNKENGTKSEFKNVTFNDFTILYKARSELEHLERMLKKCGVPFIKFKDKKLFTGRECAHWIALLDAISSIDFTGNNRSLFKKALFTDFFSLSLEEISDDKYDKDDNDEMDLILSWKEIAKEKKWEKLIDNIIDESGISKRLCNTEKIQSLTIYKQIADYCISYLYDNNTLDDLIDNLKSLSKGNQDEEDDATIEVGVDLNSIKLMTIHASKGLQFPVVISIAGFKERNTKPKTFIYHDGDERKISFESKDAENDDFMEFKRLIYVAYTRAEYLMIIPYYNKEKSFGGILKKDTEAYLNDSSSVYKKLDCNEILYTEFANLKNAVNNILLETRKIENAKSSSNNHKTKVEQESFLEELSKTTLNKLPRKYAYSSLAHGDKEDEYEQVNDGEIEDKEGESEDNLILFDNNPIRIYGKLDSTVHENEIPTSFPKGKEIGSALHEIFEHATFTDYKEIGNNSDKLERLIINAFKHYKLKVPQHGDDNMKYILNMIYSVLNSNLPIIKGNKNEDGFFKLSSIENKDKKAELEFNFNIFKQRPLYEYFNGFIDLTFRRKYDGKEYYSILDWKSDSLNDIDLLSYSGKDPLTLHTNKNYAIQRVLYSYCLIKWLNKKYKNESLEDTFVNHFGGVYYVYIRGCNKDTSNGIYCQTWNSFKDLENAYKEIIDEDILKDTKNFYKLKGVNCDDIL